VRKKFLIYWWVLPILAAACLVAKISQQTIEVLRAEGWTYHAIKSTALSGFLVVACLTMVVIFIPMPFNKKKKDAAPGDAKNKTP